MSDNVLVSNSPTQDNPVIPTRTREITSGLSSGKHVQVMTLGFVESGTESIPTAADGIPVKIMSGSISASLASAATATEGVASVDSTAGGTQILASNSSRKGGEVRVSLNASQGVHIARGTSASASSRFYAPGDRIQLADGAVKYTGAVFAFVPSGTADVEYTEL